MFTPVNIRFFLKGLKKTNSSQVVKEDILQQRVSVCQQHVQYVGVHDIVCQAFRKPVKPRLQVVRAL